MAIKNFKSMDEYVHYLEQNPDEVEALFHDLLIGVTSFFRNPTAFEALQKKSFRIFLQASIQISNTDLGAWLLHR